MTTGGGAGILRAGHMLSLGGGVLASGPSALPAEDILSELVSSGIQPLVEEIHGRFTSSLVSVGGCLSQA